MSQPQKHYQRRESAVAWIMAHHNTSSLAFVGCLRPLPRYRPGHFVLSDIEKRTVQRRRRNPEIDRLIKQVCKILKENPESSKKLLRLNDLYRVLVKVFGRLTDE